MGNKFTPKQALSLNTNKSCNETLMLSPRGNENMPIIHNKARKIAFLVILLIEATLLSINQCQL